MYLKKKVYKGVKTEKKSENKNPLEANNTRKNENRRVSFIIAIHMTP